MHDVKFKLQIFKLLGRRIYIGLSLAWMLILLQSAPVRAQTNAAVTFSFSTMAGESPFGSRDDIGENARFDQPQGVALETNGNILITDSANSTIRELTPAGVVTTIAGFPGSSGSADGIGQNARFNSPTTIAGDAVGNFYISDTANFTVRKMFRQGTNWLVTTIAGQAGTTGSADGTNGSAEFGSILVVNHGKALPPSYIYAGPSGLAVDQAGNIYVADAGNATIRKITPAGTNWIVSTIAGLAGAKGYTNGIGPNSAFQFPQGLTMDSQGNLFVADQGVYPTIREVSLVGTKWMVSTFAGLLSGWTDGMGTNASFYRPAGISRDAANNLYVVDTVNDDIREINTAGEVSTVAGSLQANGNADGVSSNAFFNYPTGVASDAFGNLVVADCNNNEIRQVTSAGSVSTLAGSVVNPGNLNGVGGQALFNTPYGLAADRQGNVYVADMENNEIRGISPSGRVSTLAGSTQGSVDGVGVDAEFNSPQGVAIDLSGNIIVADTQNSTIRKITPAGVITTVGGQAGGFSYADGLGTNALFNFPSKLTIDGSGNIYVADTGNYLIRMITPAGNSSTIAGQVKQIGHLDGVGTNAIFGLIQGIAVDTHSNLFVADYDLLQVGNVIRANNSYIRMISYIGTNWTVSTIAGPFYGGLTRLGLGGLAIDENDNIYVADRGDSILMMLSPEGTNWAISLVGGQSGVFDWRDGNGTAALFDGPSDVAVDNSGNLYIADAGNNIIRKGVFSQFGPANLTSYVPAPMNASLSFTLTPPEANGQWHFPWEQGWHNSGDTVSNLVAGNYTAVFRSLPGWLAYPPSLTVVLTNNGSTIIPNQYFPAAGANTNNGAGTLVVNLGVNPPPGAGWDFIGDNNPTLPSGLSTNLAPGNYLIEFAYANGRVKPSNLSVPVAAGQTTYVNVSYLLAGSAPANTYLPSLVPLANMTNVNQYPFGYCGQLESDVGYGSGAAVSTNVVLTAAHLIFDDQTLSYVSQAYWFIQEEASISQPLPQAARGWYVLNGYAAQRTNDINSSYSPDQSSPQSQNLDVAALYFLQQVAGGGEGGYLPSDAVPNVWLTSTSLKMLVGYPVDGSQFGTNVNAGQMYQTDPQPYPLTISADAVSGQQEVYQAPWFFSYPGNSGGPLYVQLNGYYYPAGVYLGTLYSGSTPTASLIRAIDSQVVNLITNAQTLGDSGTNGSGGGVTILNSGLGLGTAGYLQWQLGPPSAVTAGAAWQLAGDTSYSTATNYTEMVTTSNLVTVQFKPVSGWHTPTNQTVKVLLGQLNIYNATYTVSNPVLTYNPATGLGLSGTTGTLYELELRTNLVSGNWLPVSTNTLTNAAFNLLLPKSNFTNHSGFYRAVWLPL